jgi:hypothetical protein
MSTQMSNPWQMHSHFTPTPFLMTSSQCTCPVHGAHPSPPASQPTDACPPADLVDTVLAYGPVDPLDATKLSAWFLVAANIVSGDLWNPHLQFTLAGDRTTPHDAAAILHAIENVYAYSCKQWDEASRTGSSELVDHLTRHYNKAVAPIFECMRSAQQTLLRGAMDLRVQDATRAWERSFENRPVILSRRSGGRDAELVRQGPKVAYGPSGSWAKRPRVRRGGRSIFHGDPRDAPRRVFGRNTAFVCCE